MTPPDRERHLKNVDDRIILTDKNALFRVKSLYFLSLFLAFSIYGGITLTLGISIYSIFFLFVSSLITAVWFTKKYRLFCTATLRGDCLIFNSVTNEKCVAPVKSIRKIKTRNLGRKTYTSLMFQMDGTKRKTILVSDAESQYTPKEIIRSLQKEEK